MVKKVLVYIISPIHVISSICAIKTLYEEKSIKAILLVHWPGVNDAIVKELGDIVRVLSMNFKFINKVISISTAQKAQFLLNKNIQTATYMLNLFVGEADIHELYYAHDIDGGMYQFLCTAYPNAKRICFGDAFGNVYQKEIHLSFLNVKKNEPNINNIKKPTRMKFLNIPRIAQKIKTTLSNIKIRVFNKTSKKSSIDIVFQEFKPNMAVLILPIDQSGEYLKTLPFIICKKKLFLEILDQCIFNAQELQNYCTEIINKYCNRNKLLLMTENFAEGNFIDFNKEIEMWCTIIRRKVDKGGVVFLKSHPGETLNRNERIRKCLEGDIEVVELDKRFKRYPIEIWRELVLNCKIVCLSYPIISLKYIYDINVIQTMNDGLIEKWFPEWVWASYKNALSLYMEPLKRLPSWDGKGVLYTGKYKAQNF